MLDWTHLTLFLYILMRMTGFVLFNPLLGRRSIPGIVRAGFSLALAFTVFSAAPGGSEVPGTVVEFMLRLILELGLGLALGLVMHFFFAIPVVAGFTIDTQMGLSMAATYDATSGISSSVTSTLFNVLMTLLFFTANGHLTLLRLLLTSGEAVPFGAASLGGPLPEAMAEIFVECMLLSVKLAMPILAAELLGQAGMGILMKAIPQINVFAINIELKVIIGLALLLLLLSPTSEFLMGVERDMLTAVRDVMTLLR